LRKDLFLEEETYFWSGHNNRQESKMRKKEEKQHARGEACKARRKENLTMIGLGFLTKVVMAISL